MIDSKFINDIAKKLSDAVPKSVRGLGKDMEKNFRAVLQGAFSKMDLVTREEFDAQARVLERTRKKVDAIEKLLKEKKVSKAKSTKK